LSFLACDSNDLCRKQRSPDAVADDLMSLCRFLVNRRGVGRVVVCELLIRLKANRHFEIPLAAFQTRVVKANNLLQAECQKSEYPIVWWKHSHVVRAAKSPKADGTHLNEHGMKVFHHSIYRAVWLQLQHVIGKV
jgi:lysophospholipase L1-like esterase